MSTESTDGSWPPPDWERRFRARRVGLPEWAQLAPDRAVVVASVGGTLEVHSLTPSTGRMVRATKRANGTTEATIDPHGTWVWWFCDSDGDEFGHWRRQPFGSPPHTHTERPIALPDAYDAGLHLAEDGTVVVGRSGDFGSQVHALYVGVQEAGTAPRLLYSHAQAAEAAALSRDGNLIAIEHSERGDSRHPALRILRVDTGVTVADFDDGPGRGLFALEFAPGPGDSRLLVRHERAESAQLLIWDVHKRGVWPLELGVPGEVADAHWYPDGSALLVALDHHARTLTYRYHLTDGSVQQVGAGNGTVAGATARPDGDVWLARSSAAQPRDVISAHTGRSLVTLGENRVPGSVPVEDVWADGPAGRVHALLRRPEGVAEPYPVVVDVHGGPTWHESDSFSPYAAAWVDHGYAVLSVNYRGSTGYGNPWRDALQGRIGHIELADIAAIHDVLIAAGVVDSKRSILAGASWGGYVTLLGLGTQPERWALGIAGVPVADYVTAYADEMDALQAFDRSLFGGSPSQVPQAYTDSSPITYVGQVRAPVLILAGKNDPRCPYRQIENYADALRAHGGDLELYTYDAGHGSAVDEERVRQMRAELDFAARHLPHPHIRREFSEHMSDTAT